MIRRMEKWAVEEPPINLTALIDVVFVILITFMIIAPLLEIDQVQLAEAAPSDSKVAAKEQGPISIHVLQDNRIRFNQEYVTPEQLLFLLKQAKNRYPEGVPQVFHDQRAFFGTYQEIKNAAELAGFDQMEIVLKPGS